MESAATRLPSLTPFTSSGVKVRRYAPIVGRAKNAIGQRELSHFVSAEWVDSAVGINLMNNVPNAVQAVANYEHKRQPQTEKAEHGEYNHRYGFNSPRSLISEIRGERQIKPRDCNEKQSKKDLLSSCREYFLGNENGSRCREQSDRCI